MDSFYDERLMTLKIIIGDEMGYVRIQDASRLFDEIEGLEPVDVVTGNIKRNPWRIFKFDKTNKTKEREGDDGGSDSDSNINIMERDIDPMLNEDVFSQIGQWKAHKDSIKFIKYIDETDVPLIFTAGLDKMAKIWNLKGELMGTLRQGVMKVPDRPWDFPLHQYEGMIDDRNDNVNKMLEEVKRKRDLDMQNRKMFSRGPDKKSHMTARAMDRTTQPVVSPLSRTFHKELDYSTASAMHYDFDINESERERGDDHSANVKRLLENVKRIRKQQMRYNKDLTHDDLIEEEEEKLNAGKIGPFPFDIDHDIDAEILKNDEVYKDLKELNEKFKDKDKDKTKKFLASKSLGRRKR